MMLTVPLDTGPVPKDGVLAAPGAVLLPDPSAPRFAVLDPSGSEVGRSRVELEEPTPKVVKPGKPLTPSDVKPRLDPTVERLESGPLPIGAAPGAPTEWLPTPPLI